jgi:Transposase IS116/IS110/IS902 family
VVSDPFGTKAGRVVVGLLAEGWTPPAWPRPAWPSWGWCSGSGLAAVATDGQPAAHPGRLRAGCHPAATVGKPATLAALLDTLAALDRQIAGLEAEMAPLLAATQGAKLTQIRGVATVAAAGLVALVGHTGRWSEWSKVWRAAGLDPARSQSGASDTSYGISREGSAWGGGRSLTWPPASAGTGTLAGQRPSPHHHRAQAPQSGAGRGRQPGRTDLLCPDGQQRRL